MTLSVETVKNEFFKLLGIEKSSMPDFYENFFKKGNKILQIFPNSGPYREILDRLYEANVAKDKISKNIFKTYYRFCNQKISKIKSFLEVLETKPPPNEDYKKKELLKVYDDHEDLYAQLPVENNFFNLLTNIVYIKFNIIFWDYFDSEKNLFETPIVAIKDEILKNMANLAPHIISTETSTFHQIESEFKTKRPATAMNPAVRESDSSKNPVVLTDQITPNAQKLPAATKPRRIPTLSIGEMTALINNYSTSRKGCTGNCLIKSRPAVVSTGTYANKKITNVNPFFYLQKKAIRKYHFMENDIEALIKVGDLLVNHNFNTLVGSIEILLTKFYETSRLTFILYADCLIGLFLWDQLEDDFPLSFRWDRTNNETIKPLKVSKNIVWVFFDMVMNFNYMLNRLTAQIKIENGVPVTNNLVKDMAEYIKYEFSATDGFLSNYYDDVKKLSANCVLFTLLEALVLQMSGVSNDEIFLRLEVDKTKFNALQGLIFEQGLSLLDGTFRGAQYSTHWALRHKENLYRTKFDLCTDQEINFGSNTLKTAMAILFPSFSYWVLIVLGNVEKIAQKLYQKGDSIDDFYGKSYRYIRHKIDLVLDLELQVKIILENLSLKISNRRTATAEDRIRGDFEKSKKIITNFLELFVRKAATKLFENAT